MEICSHCARAVSRRPNLRVGVNFSHVFEIPDPDSPIHYTTCMIQSLQFDSIYDDLAILSLRMREKRPFMNFRLKF